MLTRILNSAFKKPISIRQRNLRQFSSKIKTNRNFGEDAPPKNRNLTHSSKYEREGKFPDGNLFFQEM